MHKLKYKTYYLRFIGDFNSIVKVRAKNSKAAKIKASNLFEVQPPSKLGDDPDLIDCQGYELGDYTPEDR